MSPAFSWLQPQRPLQRATLAQPGLASIACASARPAFTDFSLKAGLSHGKVFGGARSCRGYAVADGGQGLREELENQFPDMEFILDKPHLRKHLYETAEALSFNQEQQHQWVHSNLDQISLGHVQRVSRLASSFSHACQQPSFPKASVGNPGFDPLKAGFPLKNPAGMTD